MENFLFDCEIASAVFKLICIGKSLDANFSNYPTFQDFVRELNKNIPLKNKVLKNMHGHFAEQKMQLPFFLS